MRHLLRRSFRIYRRSLTRRLRTFKHFLPLQKTYLAVFFITMLSLYIAAGCGGGSDGDSHHQVVPEPSEQPEPQTPPPEPEPEPEPVPEPPPPTPGVRSCVVTLAVSGNFDREVDIWYTDLAGNYQEVVDVPNSYGDDEPGEYVLRNIFVPAGEYSYVFVIDGAHGLVPLDNSEPFRGALTVFGRNDLTLESVLDASVQGHGLHTRFFADDRCLLY